MTSLARKDLLKAAAAALMIVMIPAMMAAIGVRAPGVEEVHAGGSVDLNVTFHGANSDGTIYNGEEIYVSASDLAKSYGMTEDEFTGLVSSKKVGVHFSVSYYYDSDTGMMNPIEIEKGQYSQMIKTTFSTGAYRATISPGWYPHDGVFAAVCLHTESTTEEVDSNYNNNTESHKIVDRFESKTQINSTYYKSCTFNKATLVFSLAQQGQYRRSDFSGTYTANDTMFRFFNSKGKEFAHFKRSGSTNLEMKIPISYGKNKVTMGVYSIYDGKEYFANSYILNLTSAKVGKNTVRATKLSKNKVYLRWNGVKGVSGYYVYKGSKKIKKLKKSARKYTVSKKGAGKAKYRVIPFYKKHKGKSNKVKPKANVFKTGYSSYYGNDGVRQGSLKLMKVSGNGKKYTATFYSLNNSIFKLEKYKKIVFKIYADGKLVGKKTIRNKKFPVKPLSSRKMVIRFKGKERDIKYASITYSVKVSPRWEYGLGPA